MRGSPKSTASLNVPAFPDESMVRAHNRHSCPPDIAEIAGTAPANTSPGAAGMKTFGPLVRSGAAGAVVPVA